MKSKTRIRLNLDTAIRVRLPSLQDPFKPLGFETPDGRRGWVLRLPDRRPIATPAYSDGHIFVGGGYGSYEFYKFDAATGELVWRIRTRDDGPSAAVVADGLVAFNTECCTVIVCEETTGRVVWEEWLGDPLMSQPAVDSGRLYMVYPKSNGRRDHYVRCTELRTGRHIWEQPITGDAITAPVIDSGRVYISCLDGTSFCFDASTGHLVWKKSDGATCAPIVAAGDVICTEKRMRQNDPVEGVRTKEVLSGRNKQKSLYAEDVARYLSMKKGGGVGLTDKELAGFDASVGFATAPFSAKLHAAADHVGVYTVAGGCSYQGSRPVYANGHILSAKGANISSVRHEDGTESWRASVSGGEFDGEDQVFCPPSLGRECVYLCSKRGHLVCLGREDGAPRFLYALGHPITFQASLAKGSMYVGTADGVLVCLETGSDDADGWYMWGGNAQHNKCG